MEPLVSIITVSYNSERFIEDTIRSVLNQSYKNIEYIIIDGQSKDSTLNIIKKYEKEFNGRMRFISEKDRGIYDAMNKGIELSTGDIIGLINSDDYLNDIYVIENIVECFKENKKIELVYGNLDFISEDNKDKIVRKWRDEEYDEEAFKKGWHPAHPTIYMKRKIYATIGKFSLDYRIAADYDLMLRIFEKYKPKCKFINKVLVKMRVGGISTSGFKSKLLIIKECSMAWKKNGLKKPFLFDIIRLTRKINQI